MFVKKTKSPADVLAQVLPGLEPISAAPRGISEVPGFYECSDIDEFEKHARALESGKAYKCLDSAGNVYTVSNPWMREYREDDRGMGWVSHPKPKFIMKSGDVKKAGLQTKLPDDEKGGVEW